jgi:hypothetical protein
VATSATTVLGRPSVAVFLVTDALYVFHKQTMINSKAIGYVYD